MSGEQKTTICVIFIIALLIFGIVFSIVEYNKYEWKVISENKYEQVVDGMRILWKLKDE